MQAITLAHIQSMRVSTEKLSWTHSLHLLSKPVFAVLGNHDNWDSHEAWTNSFNSSISLIENEVTTIRINQTVICVRGLGDYYSGYYVSTDIPEDCSDNTLTLTHDPQGLLIEKQELETISFAGHTHCGQIAFPIIGAPVVPTSAPELPTVVALTSVILASHRGD